jgi:hypothetical protein
MIEATQVAGWDTAKSLLIKIDGSRQACCRADEKNDRLITREEAYAVKKKIKAEKRIVVLTGALAQFCNFRPQRQNGFCAT